MNTFDRPGPQGHQMNPNTFQTQYQHPTSENEYYHGHDRGSYDGEEDDQYQEGYDDGIEYGPGGYVPGGGYIRDQRTGIDANAALQEHRDRNPYPKSRRKPRKRKSMEEKYDYVCGCGLDYLSYSSLFNHWKIKHGGQRPPGCIVPTDRWRTGAKFLESGSIYQRKSLRDYQPPLPPPGWGIPGPRLGPPGFQEPGFFNQNHNPNFPPTDFHPPPGPQQGNPPPIFIPPMLQAPPHPMALQPPPHQAPPKPTPPPMSSSQRNRPFKSPSKKWVDCSSQQGYTWTPPNYNPNSLHEEVERMIKQHDDVMVLLEKNFIQKVPGTGSTGDCGPNKRADWKQFTEEVSSWFIGNQTIPLSFFQHLASVEQALNFLSKGNYAQKHLALLMQLQGQLTSVQLLCAFTLLVMPRLSQPFCREILGMMSLLLFSTAEPTSQITKPGENKASATNSATTASGNTVPIPPIDTLTPLFTEFTNNFFPEYIRSPEEFESVTKFRIFGAEGVRKGFLNLFLELLGVWVRNIQSIPHPAKQPTSLKSDEQRSSAPREDEQAIRHSKIEAEEDPALGPVDPPKKSKKIKTSD